MTILHVLLEEIILVQPVPQRTKPSMEGLSSSVSISKAHLDLASPRPFISPSIPPRGSGHVDICNKRLQAVSAYAHRRLEKKSAQQQREM